MSNIRIENLTDAVAYYNEKVLNNEGRIVKTFNGSKGPIARRLTHGNTGNHHVVFFKKSWNEYFGIKFRKSERIGQTCRLSILEEAATFGEVIGVVHPNGEIYTCLAQDWLSYARKNGTIWIPKGEESQEASIPASMLTPVIEDMVKSIKDVVTPATDTHNLTSGTDDKKKSGLDAYF